MEKRIDYLIQRYLNRDESDDELNELMELIASGKYRDLIEARFGKDFTKQISDTPFGENHRFPRELGDIRTRKPLITKSDIPHTPTLGISLFQIAAVISIIIAVGFIGLYISRQGGVREVNSVLVTTVSTSSAVKKIILSDGSIVWLKGESTLTYPGKFGSISREVSLTGEALFEVAKDSSRPFVIDCGDLTTRVLGTSFNIRSDRKNTEILVLTGKVSVTPRGEKKTVYANPTEKIIYNVQSKMLTKGTSRNSEVTASINNTEYSMVFNDISMREVGRKIEGKFSVDIRFADDRISNCFVIADFTDQSLETTLSMLSKLLDFQYEIQDNVVTISGTGCEQRDL